MTAPDSDNRERPDPLRYATTAGADVRELRARLLAAVRRRAPAWIAADAEDIVQTVLVRILDRERRGGGKGSYGASYLEKAAQTALIDVLRARFRRREAPLDAPGEEPLDVPDARSTDSEGRLNLSDGLRDCLGGLTAPRRAAVASRLLGHSVPEAADLLGWTRKKVEHLVGRGLDQLRACLRGKGIGP